MSMLISEQRSEGSPFRCLHHPSIRSAVHANIKKSYFVENVRQEGNDCHMLVQLWTVYKQLLYHLCRLYIYGKENT